MGAALSVPLNNVFGKLAQIPPDTISSMIGMYLDDEYGFLLDISQLQSLASLEEKEAKQLMHLLTGSSRQDEMVNATIYLITLVLLCDNESFGLANRLSRLFQVMDFSGLGSLTYDQTTVLFVCVAGALSSIVERRDGSPDANGRTEVLCASMFKAVDRKHSDPLSRNEFISISTQSLETLGEYDLNAIYEKVFLGDSFEFGLHAFPAGSPKRRPQSPEKGPQQCALQGAVGGGGSMTNGEEKEDQEALEGSDNAAENEDQDFDPMQGFVEVHSIALYDLRCRGMILGVDRRYDPFVEIEILNNDAAAIAAAESEDENKWMRATDVRKHAASDVEWSELPISIPIARRDLKRKHASICIRAMDYAEGKRKIKFLCQSVTVDKKLILSHIDKWLDVEGDLIDERKKAAGRFELKIRYAEKAKENLEYGHFDMCQMVVTHIKPTDIDSEELPQDIYTDIRLGDGAFWTCRTARTTPINKEVAWLMQFTDKIPKQDLMKQTLQIRLRGRDARSSDKVIGRAIVRDLDLVFLDEGKWTQFIGDISDREGHIKGKFSLTVKYRALDSAAKFPELPDPHNISAPPLDREFHSAQLLQNGGENMGIFEVFWISVADLVLVNGQEAYSYVEIDVEQDKDWQFDTDPDEVGGRHAMWESVDFSGPMELTKLARDNIRIRAKSYGNGCDTFIGKATIPGVRFTENFNRIVEVTGVLLNKEGDAARGKFCIRGRFREITFDDSGFLDVNTVDVTKSDSSSEVKFEFAEMRIGDGSEWSVETDPVVPDGPVSSWRMQVSHPITQKGIAGGTVKLRIRSQKAFDHSVVTGHAVVTNGLELFANDNKWVTVSGDMMEENGAVVSGQYTTVVKFRSTGTSPKFILSDNEISALHGYLEVFFLKFTHLKSPSGLFGTRIDPYGEMSVGDGSLWRHITESKHDAGSKAQWSPHATGSVSVESIKEGTLMLRAYDKNRGGGVDRVIGESEVDLKSALSNLDEWVDVEGELTYGKKSFGRYAIRVRYRVSPLRTDLDKQPCVEVAEELDMDMLSESDPQHEQEREDDLTCCREEGDDDKHIPNYKPAWNETSSDPTVVTYVEQLLEHCINAHDPMKVFPPIHSDDWPDASVVPDMNRGACLIHSCSQNTSQSLAVDAGVQCDMQSLHPVSGPIGNQTSGIITMQSPPATVIESPINSLSPEARLNPSGNIRSAVYAPSTQEESPIDGYLEISNLNLMNLKNTGGIFSSQDPFAEFVVGDGSQWKFSTDTQQRAGKTAGWALDISGRISVKELKLGMFTLRVKSRNILVGRAPVALDNMFANIDRWVDIRGDIFDMGKRCTGQYRLCMRYVKLESKV